jgi:AcrR family transcriptional regulator
MGVQMTKPTDRKSQQAGRTRVAILEGAARAFAAKGYETATMADIAGEAGYSAPTLYNYFDNKEAIVVELLEHVISEHVALFDESLPEDLTFAQKLEILLLRKCDLEHRRSETMSVLMQLGKPAAASGTIQMTMMRGLGRLMARYTSWIAESASPEELNGRDPADLAFFLWGLHHSLLLRSHVLGEHPETPTESARLVLDFFLHGLGAANSQEPD